MRQLAQYVSWGVGLWLNVLVIRAMLRGQYRQYRFAFAYVLALLLTTVIEIAAKTGPRSAHWNIYYWIDDVILNVLVFCVVLAFIDEAASQAARRPLGRGWLIAGASLIGVTSFLVHSGAQRLNSRMTLVSRDLNAAAVILDLILWSLLVTSRRPDRRLLLLSGGLGIQLTGATIGEELGSRFRSAVFAGALLEVVTYLVALYIWWRAFRPARTPQSAG
jgi:hypothetical protein